MRWTFMQIWKGKRWMSDVVCGFIVLFNFTSDFAFLRRRNHFGQLLSTIIHIQECERTLQLQNYTLFLQSQQGFGPMLSEVGATMEKPSVMWCWGCWEFLLGGHHHAERWGVVCQAEWQQAPFARRCLDRRTPDMCVACSSTSVQPAVKTKHRDAGGAVWHLGSESHCGDTT